MVSPLPCYGDGATRQPDEGMFPRRRLSDRYHMGARMLVPYRVCTAVRCKIHRLARDSAVRVGVRAHQMMIDL